MSGRAAAKGAGVDEKGFEALRDKRLSIEDGDHIANRCEQKDIISPSKYATVTARKAIEASARRRLQLGTNQDNVKCLFSALVLGLRCTTRCKGSTDRTRPLPAANRTLPKGSAVVHNVPNSCWSIKAAPPATRYDSSRRPVPCAMDSCPPCAMSTALASPWARP